MTGKARYVAYAPLLDLETELAGFDISAGVRIEPRKKIPTFVGLEPTLSPMEWERAKGARHWIVHQWTPGDGIEPAEVQNLLLLALWLVQLNRVSCAYRIEMRQDVENNNSVKRMLDRFQWIPGSIEHFDFDRDKLEQTAGLYRTVASMCAARSRLNDALHLTLAGCWNVGWQAAIICHASAAEALLTYSEAPQITARLGKTFACLTESSVAGRHSAFREFVTLYGYRSDIAHGRVFNIRQDERLGLLVRWQNVLRTLWKVVCARPPLAATLELTDFERQQYFDAVEQGYHPPSL